MAIVRDIECLMSKVYSFRLNDDNPREAQAKRVINAWVGEGYTLRQVIVDALLSYKKKEIEQSEISSIMEQIQILIMAFGKQPLSQYPETALSNSFLDAIKQSVREGVKV